MDKYSVETVAVNVDFELIVVRRFCLSQQVCKSFMLLDARIEAAFLVINSRAGVTAMDMHGQHIPINVVISHCPELALLDTP